MTLHKKQSELWPEPQAVQGPRLSARSDLEPMGAGRRRAPPPSHLSPRPSPTNLRRREGIYSQGNITAPQSPI